jgi:hypothetical protein
VFFVPIGEKFVFLAGTAGQAVLFYAFLFPVFSSFSPKKSGNGKTGKKSGKTGNGDTPDAYD